MNQRNVEALAELLRAVPPNDFMARDKHQRDITHADLSADALAAALAAHGVLVPASLSIKEREAIAWATMGLDEHANSSAGGTDLIPTLERIARGEPPEGERPR